MTIGAAWRDVAWLLAVEADDGLVLLIERSALGRRSRGGRSRTLLEGGSLGSGFVGLGHGLGHLFVLPSKLLEKRERKIL